MWLLLACSFTKSNLGGSDSAESAPPEETAGDTADTAASEVNPFITAVTELYCQDEGEQGETWYVTVLCDDPQGADTVQIGSQTILAEDGTPIANYGLDCYDGVCDSYWRAEYDGISCAMAASILFVFAVQDIDFHWSEPWYHSPA
jgi:hypothetical protein